MTLRVGRIAFLNSYPLYWGLCERGAIHQESGLCDCLYRYSELLAELLPGVPTDLNRMLLAGEIDFGPISSIAYARNYEKLVLSRRLSISSVGPVQSIQLVTRRSLDEIRTVALTPKSETSIAMLKTIMRLRYERDPSYHPLAVPPEEALEEYDAVLLIGDDGLSALHAPSQGAMCHDLGQMWNEWTGLPMVYALWAAREDSARAHSTALIAVEEELVRSLRLARLRLPQVVRSAAGCFAFGPASVARYFRVLQYGLPPRNQRGLIRFYELARAAGELSEIPQWRFLDESREDGALCIA